MNLLVHVNSHELNAFWCQRFRKGVVMLRWSSVWFAIAFVALFAIMAALALLTFGAVVGSTSYSFSFSSFETAMQALKSQKRMSEWSAAADMLSAVVGLPVALAGSIVAIYIAHRAFVVSVKQVDSDLSSFVEVLSEKSADSFWDLCNSIRNLDELVQKIPVEALEFHRKTILERHKINDRLLRVSNEWEISALRKDLFAIETLEAVNSGFQTAALDVADCVLRVLRDPLSSRGWANSARKNEEVMNAANYALNEMLDVQGIGLPPIRGIDFSVRDPGAVTQAIRQSVAESDRLGYNIADRARAVLVQKRFKSFRVSKTSGRYLKKGTKNSGRPENADSKNAFEILKKGLSGSEYRLSLSNAEKRLLAAGAMLRCEHYRRDSATEVFAFNSGALLLALIIKSIPDAGSQSDAIQLYLDESSDASRSAKSSMERSYLSKNIESYIQPNLELAATEIIENPHKLIMYVGDMQGFDSSSLPYWKLWKKRDSEII